MGAGETITRTDADVVADLAALDVRRAELHEERRQIRAAYNAEVVAAFLRTRSIRDVARQFKIPYGAAQGILYRAGYTQEGIETVQRQVETAVGALA